MDWKVDSSSYGWLPGGADFARFPDRGLAYSQPLHVSNAHSLPPTWPHSPHIFSEGEDQSHLRSCHHRGSLATLYSAHSGDHQVYSYRHRLYQAEPIL